MSEADEARAKILGIIDTHEAQERAIRARVSDPNCYAAGVCDGAIEALRELRHEIARSMTDTPPAE